MLAITFVVLFFVVKDDFKSILLILKSVNALWVFVGFIVMAFSLLFRSLALREVIQGYNFKYSIKNALKLEVITAFFNGVTPFSTGGQPMQVVLLKDDGVRMTKGTNIIMMNFVLYQAALVLLGIIALLLSFTFNLFPSNHVLNGLIIIGFTINTLIMVLLLVISYAKKFTGFISHLIIKFLYKIHLVKNIEKTKLDWEEKLNDFHEGTVFIKKNKLNSLRGFIYHFIGLLLLYVIPLFAFYSLHDYTSLNVMTAIVSSAYTMIIGSFVPIPGGSGGIEYGYAQFIGSFANATFVSASLLIWRLTTYYLPMVIGGVMFGTRGSEEKCE